MAHELLAIRHSTMVIVRNFLADDRKSVLAGITFTSKQIKMNERIYMKIGDIDETGQWLGSLAIGKKGMWLNRKNFS